MIAGVPARRHGEDDIIFILSARLRSNGLAQRASPTRPLRGNMQVKSAPAPPASAMSAQRACRASGLIPPDCCRPRPCASHGRPSLLRPRHRRHVVVVTANPGESAAIMPTAVVSVAAAAITSFAVVSTASTVRSSWSSSSSRSSCSSSSLVGHPLPHRAAAERRRAGRGLFMRAPDREGGRGSRARACTCRAGRAPAERASGGAERASRPAARTPSLGPLIARAPCRSDSPRRSDTPSRPVSACSVRVRDPVCRRDPGICTRVSA